MLKNMRVYNFIYQMGAQNGKEQPLKIKIQSGDTQSQQLFDFQSQKRVEYEEVMSFPSKLVLNDDDLNYLKDESLVPFYETLYNLNQNTHHEIQLDCAQSSAECNPIWRVIRDNELFPIKVGDELKLGKIRMTLKSIVTKDVKKRQYQRQATEQQNNSFEKDHFGKNIDDPCRICFDKADTFEDPLVSLCNCSGSVKYIHYNCLKDWITNNIDCRKSESCLSYTYLEPICEICKSKIKNQFQHQGNKYTLYQFQKMEAPYALFENSIIDQQTGGRNKISTFMIKLLEGGEISVGRNDNSQVVLKDISVSRNHCNFRYEKGNLFIQNQSSKFGTLVRPKGKWEFQPRNGIALQLGSKLIQISQQNNFSNCCCVMDQSYSLYFKYTHDSLF